MPADHFGLKLPSWAASAIGGVMLLLVGSALLADQLGFAMPYRWPFLILLLPAGVAMFDSVRIAGFLGWRSVQPLARLAAGALFAAISILLFLHLDTGMILPGLIMALGLATIVRAMTSRAPLSKP
jgi:hypothetical protein